MKHMYNICIMKHFTCKKPGIGNVLVKFLKTLCLNPKSLININKSLIILIFNKKNGILLNNSNNLIPFDNNKQYYLFDISKNNLDKYKKLLQHFKIKPKIIKNVDIFINELEEKYDINKIFSLHIRSWNSDTNVKTNNEKAYKRSQNFNLNIYIKNIDILLENKYDFFFVSTDNNNIINQLKSIYGDKVLYYSKNNSISNIQNDFTNMLLLGKFKTFIVTKRSTFSQFSYLFSKIDQHLIFC